MKKKYIWAMVELPNKKREWYQLSKDLQYATRLDYIKFNKLAYQTLRGALINVPISKYKKGKAKIVTGKIIRLKSKNKRTFNSRYITRSQFLKPTYNKFGLPKYHLLFNYLKHDYDKSNKLRIALSILKLTKIELFKNK